MHEIDSCHADVEIESQAHSSDIITAVTTSRSVQKKPAKRLLCIYSRNRGGVIRFPIYVVHCIRQNARLNMVSMCMPKLELRIGYLIIGILIMMNMSICMIFSQKQDFNG